MLNNLSDNITLSVVIPCFNAKNTIGKTLKAICNQQTDFDYEIIVVDSSNDGTTEIIRNDFPEVNLYHLERQTLPGSGRNFGVKNSRGEYIAFTDSDCVPDPDWLARIVKTFETVQTDGVGGCLINGYPYSPTAWVSHLIEFNEWTETSTEGYVTNIPSANLAYKRKTFYDLNVEFCDIFPSEDTIFNWTAKNKGAKLYFDPQIRIVHLSRVGFFKLFKHQFRLGAASAEARRTTTLPGRIFIRYPVLSLLLPFIRWIRAFGRLLKKDIAKFIIFISLTPVYLLATFAWSFGFITKKDFPATEIKIHDVNYEPSKSGA